MVECEDKIMGKMYAKIAYQFMTVMVEVGRELLHQVLFFYSF